MGTRHGPLLSGILCPSCERRGYRVLALDFIGHGLSDRVVNQQLLTSELHMATIKVLFDQVLSKSSGPVIIARS